MQISKSKVNLGKSITSGFKSIQPGIYIGREDKKGYIIGRIVAVREIPITFPIKQIVLDNGNFWEYITIEDGSYPSAWRFAETLDNIDQEFGRVLQ